MKLYLLEAIEIPGDNLWDPWYDKVTAFVVRAKTEAEARKFAAENAGVVYRVFHFGKLECIFQKKLPTYCKCKRNALHL